MAIIIGNRFMKNYFWKYVDVTFEPLPDDFTDEDKLDSILIAKTVKTCKDFGWRVEATAEKLRLDIEDVKKIYFFDDLGLFNWTDTYTK